MHRNRKISMVISVILFVYFCCGIGYAETTYSCTDGIHEFESQILTPNTEDTQGEVENTCIRCGYSYIEYLPATGHQYGEWLVAAEDKSSGMKTETRVCALCHRSETQEVPTEEDGVWKANQMDYVLSASIGGVWGYAVLMLWYDSQVINWYKKACRAKQK